MIEFHQVSRTFNGPDGPVQALDDVSFVARPGEVLVVQGPSGCGKTTLLLTAGALLRPTSGKVLLEGKDLYDLDQAARAVMRATRIGFVFQQFHLVPYLTVLENVVAAALCPDTVVRQRAETLVEQVGLTDRMHYVPAQLSTGQRQRAALARAVLNEPDVLLADEPTGNLDEANGQAVLDFLQGFAADGGTVVLVTHDSRILRRGHPTIRLDRGRCVPDGEASPTVAESDADD